MALSLEVLALAAVSLYLLYRQATRPKGLPVPPGPTLWTFVTSVRVILPGAKSPD